MTQIGVTTLMKTIQVGTEVYRVSERIAALVTHLAQNADQLTGTDVKIIFNCRGTNIKPILELYQGDLTVRPR